MPIFRKRLRDYVLTPFDDPSTFTERSCFIECVRSVYAERGHQVAPEDGYTIFSYRLHTTDDFYQEVCRYGNYMEVLYPKDVRAEMMKIIKGMDDEYAGVSRKDCKKKVPGMKELKAQ